MESMTFI